MFCRNFLTDTATYKLKIHWKAVIRINYKISGSSNKDRSFLNHLTAPQFYVCTTEVVHIRGDVIGVWDLPLNLLWYWDYESYVPLLFIHVLVLKNRDLTFTCEHSVAESFYSTWTTERVLWCGVRSCRELWKSWLSCFRRRVLFLHMNCIVVDWCKHYCRFCRPAAGMRACTATKAASCRNKGFAFSRAASRWGPTTDFLCSTNWSF